MDQHLCVGSSTGEDGCEPGLAIGEDGLVMLRDRDLTRLMPAWEVKGFGNRLLEGELAREELLVGKEKLSEGGSTTRSLFSFSAPPATLLTCEYDKTFKKSTYQFLMA